MGDTHRLFGAHWGAAAGAVAFRNPLAVAVCAGLGWATATWPDRVEKIGLGHRRISHFWGVAWAIIGAAFFAPLFANYIVFGIGQGWLSHIVGDFMFGKAHTRDLPGGGFVVLRGRGVPAPFKYRGFGWKVNGPWELRVRRILKRTMPYFVGLVMGATILLEVM